MNQRIKAFYFSATETTKKIATGIAEKLAESSGGKSVVNVDFTLPEARKEPASFAEHDIVVAGLPVYAGRVPNVLLKYLNTIKGNGALAVAVVVYGNRHYDDALIEWRDILESRASTSSPRARLSENTSSRILGQNRPISRPVSRHGICRQIYQKLSASQMLRGLIRSGNKLTNPITGPDRTAIPSILKVVPKTSDDCIHCGLCVSSVPWGPLMRMMNPSSRDLHQMLRLHQNCR